MKTRHRRLVISGQAKKLLSFFIVSLGAIQGSSGAAVHAKETTVTFSCPEYRLVHDENGLASIEAPGYGRASRTGFPRLPVRTLSIPLPPGSRVLSVTCETDPAETMPLSGALAAAGPFMSSAAVSADADEILRAAADAKRYWYTQDRMLPADAAVYEGCSVQRGAVLVNVRFSPFRYNPVKRLLQRYAGVRIHISYDAPPEAEENTLRTGRIHKTSADTTVLLIIGAAELEPSVADFTIWKQSLGFRVDYQSLESIGGGAPGEDTETAIRNFLRQTYEEAPFSHLLLLGDYRQIPVPRLYADPDNPFSYFAVPSDAYYAELNESWDADGDGRPGEYEDDGPPGAPDIAVGRIPMNDPDPIYDVLAQAVNFEKTNGSAIPEALLLGGISNFANEANRGADYARTDGAVLMELLKSDIFMENGSTTLYEKSGIDTSLFLSDLALDRQNLHDAWHTGRYRLITWWTHGSYEAVQRKIWKEDDGDGIAQEHELEWKECLTSRDHPRAIPAGPVIFANSCDNGWPEKESLAGSLLRDGSSAIIASARQSYYILGWQRADDGGNASLTCLFWEYFYRGGMTLGEAFNRARTEYLARFPDAWQHLHNSYTFQVFGDPTLRLSGTAPDAGGIRGQIRTGSPSRQPVAGVRVVSQGSGQETVSDSAGHFSLFPLSAGPGELLFILENGETFARPVDVEGGAVREIEVELGHTGGIQETAGAPGEFGLSVNYPNPFNSSTVIPFSVPAQTHVSITVYNALGAKIRSLVAKELPAGAHETIWNGLDDQGSRTASGMYLIRMRAASFSASRKILFIN